MLFIIIYMMFNIIESVNACTPILKFAANLILSPTSLEIINPKAARTKLSTSMLDA